MKKWCIVAMTLCLAVTAAGCGDKKEEKAADAEKSEQEVLLSEDEHAEHMAVDGKIYAVNTDDISKYVELGEYKNLEVTAQKIEITDKDVEDFIDQQMAYMAVPIKEDRPVQDGDTVNMDYTGYMDGAEFEGGSAQGAELLIGSGQFIDGFEEGLIGAKKGEEVTLDIAFPDPYPNNPDFSGKPVQFKVKVNEIKEPAELTDEWVQENSESKNVEDYRAYVKKSMAENADMNYMSDLKSNLFQKLAESSKILDYPAEPLEEIKDYFRKNIEEQYAAPAQMTLEEYFESQNISKEEAEETIEGMAKNYLDQSLIVQAVLDAEGIEITEKEYEAMLEDFAKLYGFKNAQDLLNAYYNDETMIKSNVLWSKCCDIMQETAKITDVPYEPLVPENQ